MLGFELTTSWIRVSSFNHYTRASAYQATLPFYIVQFLLALESFVSIDSEAYKWEEAMSFVRVAVVCEKMFLNVMRNCLA